MRNLKCVTIFLRKKLIWMRRSKKINAMQKRLHQYLKNQRYQQKHHVKCNWKVSKLLKIRGIRLANRMDGRVKSASLMIQSLARMQLHLKNAMTRDLKNQRYQQKTDVICYGLILKVLKIRGIRFARWMDGRVSPVRLDKKC